MCAMPQTPVDSASGYWYPDGADRGVEVLEALRRYRAAEAAMRRRTRDSMGMGETDLLAIRFLLHAQRTGRDVSPKDLAVRLGISSASTTVLVDRLVTSGHVERRPHPTDRRALVIVPTGLSDSEVRATLGAMHDRMMRVAESLQPEEAAVVIDFFERMRIVVDEVDEQPSAVGSDDLDRRIGA